MKDPAGAKLLERVMPKLIAAQQRGDTAEVNRIVGTLKNIPLETERRIVAQFGANKSGSEGVSPIHNAVVEELGGQL